MVVRVPGVVPALHDPGVYEAVKTVLEDVRSDAEREEVVEAGGAGEQRVPDDQETPPLAHQFERPGRRAHLRVVGLSQHVPSVAISLAS